MLCWLHTQFFHLCVCLESYCISGYKEEWCTEPLLFFSCVRVQIFKFHNTVSDTINIKHEDESHNQNKVQSVPNFPAFLLSPVAYSLGHRTHILKWPCRSRGCSGEGKGGEIAPSFIFHEPSCVHRRGSDCILFPTAAFQPHRAITSPLTLGIRIPWVGNGYWGEGKAGKIHDPCTGSKLLFHIWQTSAYKSLWCWNKWMDQILIIGEQLILQSTDGLSKYIGNEIFDCHCKNSLCLFLDLLIMGYIIFLL